MMKEDRRLLKLFLVNWIGGSLLGCVFAAGVLALDLAGVRGLLFRSDSMAPGLALLFGGFAFTFGALVCASAVMLHAGRDEDEPGSGPGAPGVVRLPARRR